MHLLALFSTNLTPYHNFELWITRSCLFIAISIIGPTIILIILDLLLWCFRAGQGPSSELIRRSRSGIDLLHQKARLRSNSTSSATSSMPGLEMTTQKSNKHVNFEAITPLTKKLDSDEMQVQEQDSSGFSTKVTKHESPTQAVEVLDIARSKHDEPSSIAAPEYDLKANDALLASGIHTQTSLKKLHNGEQSRGILEIKASEKLSLDSHEDDRSTTSTHRIEKLETTSTSRGSPMSSTLADFNLGKVIE